MAQYSFQGNVKSTAKAFGRRLSISTKQSVEICNQIRGKPINRARTMLEQAITLETPIKFTRFLNGAGHKATMGPGKYPVKAATEILKVLESAEANAQNTGLSSELVVEHAAAQRASRGYKYGRKRGRKEKSTHIEIVLKEVKGAKRDLTPKRQVKKAEPAKDESKKSPAKKKEKKEEAKTEKKSGQKPAKKEDKKEAPEGAKKESEPEKKTESKKEESSGKKSEEKAEKKESKESKSTKSTGDKE